MFFCLIKKQYSISYCPLILNVYQNTLFFALYLVSQPQTLLHFILPLLLYVYQNTLFFAPYLVS